MSAQVPIISRHLPCHPTAFLIPKLSNRPSKATLTHISHHLLVHEGKKEVKVLVPSESSTAHPQQPRGYFLSAAGPDKVNELIYSSEMAGKMHASRCCRLICLSHKGRHLPVPLVAQQ